MLRILGIAVSLPWLIDAGVRWILARRSRAWRPPPPPEAPSELRWLVVVPARSEGQAVAPTLASIEKAAQGHQVTTVLLLDGPDDAAVEAARSSTAISVVKMPPGPTKGAALRWLVEARRDLLDEIDAVLILDVGSRLAPGFFDRFTWPEGADAVQAWLRGTSGGVGDAISLSESAAQRWQDRGREVLCWAVQLRGTGTSYTPSTLCSIAPRIKTSIEDTEATLLLAASGASIVLSGEEAIVDDIKPTATSDAASQRSRWLHGQIAIFVRQPGAIFRLLTRKPLEGLAFITGLLSRPLTLTALLRLIFASAFLLDGLQRPGGSLSVVAGALLAASLASDLLLLRHTTDATLIALAIGGVRMFVSWCGAILLLPRAVFGWVRGRKN